MISEARLQTVLVVVVVVAGIALVGGGAITSADSTAESNSTIGIQQPLDVAVDDELGDEDGEVEVIVSFGDGAPGSSADRPPSEHIQAFASVAAVHDGIDVLEEFWLVDAVVVSVDTDAVSVFSLAFVEGVEALEANHELAVPDTEPVESPATDESHETTDGIDRINATGVWDAFDTRGEGVRVAVLDTGIHVDHPDLELYTEDSDDPTYPGGWESFIGTGGSDEPADESGHGTHVSGTVAGGDASGTHIGVAPDVELLHGQVITESGGSITNVVAGMEWAVENDVDVISMSLGGSGYSSTYVDAIEGAMDEGVVVVAGIGNDGYESSLSPGNVYDSVGVGAIDQSDDVADFSSGEEIETASSWGASAPDHWPDEYVVPGVSAPGTGVKSAYTVVDYVWLQGTSTATPHVSGAAALIQAATDDHHSPEAIVEALRETAEKPDDWEDRIDDLTDGEWDEPREEPDPRYGHGIIDVYAAVTYLADGEEDSANVAVTDASLATAEITEGETIAVEATVENTGAAAGEHTLELREDGDVVDTETVSLDAGEETVVTFERTYESAGEYDLAVDDVAAGTLAVEEEADEEGTGIVETDLHEETISAGADATVDVVVENTGDDAEYFSVELAVDGDHAVTRGQMVFSGQTVTFSFERTFDDPGEYELTANDHDVGVLTVESTESAPDVSVTDASLETAEITEGESVAIEATLETAGDAAGEHTLELFEDGDVVETEAVSLDAGEQTTVTFERTYETAGEYDLAVNDVAAGTLTVEAVDESDPVAIVDAWMPNETIDEGSWARINAAVENTGETTERVTLRLYVDGDYQSQRSQDVDPGQTTTVRFFERFDEAGEYDIAIEDEAVGTLTVEADD